ncbi:MAG: endolytic transglycosylase MltG, partial [Candidatus Zixiibacteriota bacterium]
GEYLFKMTAVALGLDKSLTPGRYNFSGKTSIYKILQKFKNRDFASAMITIPEGLTVNKIAGIFAQALGIDSVSFVNRAFDTVYIQNQYGLNNMEGYLFPETYKVPYGTKIDGIIEMMYNQLNESAGSILDSGEKDNYTRNQLMTLASIITAEAMLNDEMGLISSVYHNRLNQKMLLQADPTVIYAIGGLDRPLWYRDLKFDSPYNTYKYKGLPPGPINSPGLNAIKAAVNPETSEFLYFVADGTGRHIFSKTLREHNNAKNKIKKEKRNN